MSQEFVASDTAILEVLRKGSSLSIPEMATATEVTATAVRQRLNRLMAQGYIERYEFHEGRGRPSHRYRLTAKGHRKSGNTFPELAMALWSEIRSIEDPQVRQGLLKRISDRIAPIYGQQVTGETTEQRMESLAELFQQRQIPFEVDTSGKLPVLKAHACPYPVLAEQDRAICAMERMMFSSVIGEDLRLSECRLDGDSCCTFIIGTQSDATA